MFTDYLIIGAIIIILLVVLIIELFWVLLKNAIKHGVKQGMYNCIVQLIQDGIIDPKSIQNREDNTQNDYKQY